MLKTIPKRGKTSNKGEYLKYLFLFEDTTRSRHFKSVRLFQHEKKKNQRAEWRTYPCVVSAARARMHAFTVQVHSKRLSRLRVEDMGITLLDGTYQYPEGNSCWRISS